MDTLIGYTHSLAPKYHARVKVTNIDTPTSLLYNSIIQDCKRHYDTQPNRLMAISIVKLSITVIGSSWYHIYVLLSVAIYP
jgi:hypothetical protein